MTLEEVAERYGRCWITVRISLQDGSLHGRRCSRGQGFEIEAVCAEAWNRSEHCPHSIGAR